MRTFVVAFALSALVVAAPAMAATTINHNSTPTGGFTYGTGNDYSPANAVVLTTDIDELALRFHQTYVTAPASDLNALYKFAIGTDPLSFDWSILGTTSSAQITMKNLLTGATTSYDPFFIGNDNEVNGSGAFQNSFRLNWAGIGFDPNINNTYSVNLLSGGNSLTAYAQVGTGAVPEPSTWVTLLLGFGFIGGAMRLKRRKERLAIIYA